jgi:hypothetical protein
MEALALAVNIPADGGEGSLSMCPDPPSRLQPTFRLPVGEGDRPGKPAIELRRHC